MCAREESVWSFVQIQGSKFYSDHCDNKNLKGRFWFLLSIWPIKTPYVSRVEKSAHHPRWNAEMTLAGAGCRLQTCRGWNMPSGSNPPFLRYPSQNSSWCVPHHFFDFRILQSPGTTTLTFSLFFFFMFHVSPPFSSKEELFPIQEATQQILGLGPRLACIGPSEPLCNPHIFLFTFFPKLHRSSFFIFFYSNFFS